MVLPIIICVVGVSLIYFSNYLNGIKSAKPNDLHVDRAQQYPETTSKPIYSS